MVAMFFTIVFIACVIVFILMSNGDINTEVDDKGGDGFLFGDDFTYGWVVFGVGIFALIAMCISWYRYRSDHAVHHSDHMEY